MTANEQSRAGLISTLLALFWWMLQGSAAVAYTGRVIDASSRLPLENAIVTLSDKTTRTGFDGRFSIDGPGGVIGLRAYGYSRQALAAGELKAGPRDIPLTPFHPKGLYLSFYGVGSNKLREAALELVDKTELNAVVIDVKGDRGMIPYKSAVGLAREVGAQRVTTISDPKGLIARLHRDHIYAIARIVVFKDDPLATARPDLAVRRNSGALFRDRERLAWTDPFNKEVWNYNIAVAVEAAGLGFDEIQFDYVRFPDATGLRFSMPNNMTARLAAISGFLGAARRELTPYNVFVAVDIFGYVMWNLDDTHVGQRLEELSQNVDYISPMLYPSCFQFGIPGYRLPVAHPYEIVLLSMNNGRERIAIPSIRFRPWLQAFRDYAFDRREFTGKEIRAQISAAEKFGSDGWMLWNPRNTYSAGGMKLKGDSCEQDTGQMIQSLP
ncbi:MAG: putative glycoside hydrolase [Candidatus Binataceae bacterium]